MIEEMMKEAQDIQEFTELLIPDDINGAIEHGAMLAVYLTRTGKMLADAKKLLSDAKRAEIMDTLKRFGREAGATAQMLNDLVKSACHREQYLVDWLDRLNSTITHQMDFTRSIISKAKAEMNMNNFGGGGV